MDDDLTIDELLAEQRRHARTVTDAWLLLVATVFLLGFVFGRVWP